VPSFNEREFERRWAVPRPVYEIIREGVLSGSSFFDEKADCNGSPSASTDQKLAAAFRALVYGESFDDIVEYSGLAESTNRECLLEFAHTVRKVFEEEWLSLPSEAECMQISGEF
jgi:hypothetical protein